MSLQVYAELKCVLLAMLLSRGGSRINEFLYSFKYHRFVSLCGVRCMRTWDWWRKRSPRSKGSHLQRVCTMPDSDFECPMAIPACLGSLPAELYTAILSHVPVDLLQQTVLALTRALPLAPIPRYHLFTRIHLKHGAQVVQLYQLLRKATDYATWVKVFALESWQVDADVLVNLICLVSQFVTDLTLFIGANFAPEHLKEMFESPMPKLRAISLRFRP